ncbi:MAG: hypothetical protein KJ043_14565 [Anaerolineae bacterium]|nr:hypothetical protein [Anaerolineae bacterium]
MDKDDWQGMQADKQLRDFAGQLRDQYPHLRVKVHVFGGGVSLIVTQPTGADVAKIIYEKNQYIVTTVGQPAKRVTFDQATKQLEEALSKLS